MGKSEVKSEKKSKNARSFDLRVEIGSLEAKLKEAAAAIGKEASEKQRRALFIATTTAGKRGKEVAAEVDGLRTIRTSRSKLALKDYEQALRDAQSARDKAIKAADDDFTERQRELEAALVAANRPVEEAYNTEVAALQASTKAQLAKLKEAFEAAVLPLAEELRAIEDVAVKKRAAATVPAPDAADTAVSTPVVTAPETTGA